MPLSAAETALIVLQLHIDQELESFNLCPDLVEVGCLISQATWSNTKGFRSEQHTTS